MSNIGRHLRRFAAVATLVLALSMPGAAAAQAADTATVIRAGRLIDVRGGRVLTDQTVVVRNGKIEAVGPSASIPAGARIIDLSGFTVLPGLIDNHTHLVGSGADTDPIAELKVTAAERALQSVPNARSVLMSGFTTVRDVGTLHALVDVALRDAIARGDIVGPRMRVAGAYLTITGGGGSMSGQSAEIELPWDLRFGQANSPEQVRERVRALAAQRVDVIKMLATGAVLTHNSNVNAVEFSYEELKAGVDEARNYGLKVAAHAHNPHGVKNAVRAGVASIEHGTRLDAEAIQLMKAAGTYLVPTLEVQECITVANGFPTEFVDRAAPIFRAHLKSFHAALIAGVKIAYGTDVPVCPYSRIADEFGWMVKGGMTPMQAIQAATVNGADLIGLADEIGAIEVGKSADIIAVARDPLADVGALGSVSFVMKQGIVHKMGGQPQ